MANAAELIENIRVFVKPVIARNDYWEVALVQLARLYFKVPDVRGGNPEIAVVRPNERSSVRGTGDARWNQIISAVAQSLPVGADYNKARYQDAANLAELCREIASKLATAAEQVGMRAEPRSGD